MDNNLRNVCIAAFTGVLAGAAVTYYSMQNKKEILTAIRGMRSRLTVSAGKMADEPEHPWLKVSTHPSTCEDMGGKSDAVTNASCMPSCSLRKSSQVICDPNTDSCQPRTFWTDLESVNNDPTNTLFSHCTQAPQNSCHPNPGYNCTTMVPMRTFREGVPSRIISQ